MNVSTASVVTDDIAIGTMIPKNVRNRPAPSIVAASSISLGIVRKNCRRKKIANGVISRFGAAMPR